MARGVRPTLEDVAARAGVSRATVSRVVNGQASVDPRLTALVLAAVRELHYVPNQAARSLVTHRTNTVALVAEESDDRVFGDPFFSGIVRGVSHELSLAGVQLTLSMTQNDEQVADVASYLLSGHCDGVLLISEHGEHRLATRLVDGGVPVVIGGRPLDPAFAVPYVDNDNVEGGLLAARHLRGLGRIRVGTIAGPQDMCAGIDRLAGFRRGLGRDFRRGRVAYGTFTGPSGAAAMERLLQQDPMIDGVFVASDLMALEALTVLRRTGRRVPEDVAVVGYDDIPLAAAASPALTTVRQHTVAQGRYLVKRLLGRWQDEVTPAVLPGSDGGVVLPVELVIRESA
jgi:DNA-binding LacI/PurR family transcriptional regulator